MIANPPGSRAPQIARVAVDVDAPAPAAASAPLPALDVADLWKAFAAPLRHFLRQRTASAADADDLLQEVFLRIHRQLATLRDPSKLQGWVYRIARHAAIDHHRARRSTEPLAAEPVDEDAIDTPDGREACDLTPSLRRFIAALPPDYREPLVRHEFQGQPLAAVAADLGLSLTATKTRVQRARQRLRTMLDACCRFEFDRRGHVIEATPRRPGASAPAAPCACHRPASPLPPARGARSRTGGACAGR